MRGGLAVLDQALFAGANLALNVLLARSLDADDYGAFALVYSIYQLIAAVYTALLLEPMAVFGAGKYHDRRRDYLGLLLRGHFAVTFAMAGMLAIAAIVAQAAGAGVARDGAVVLAMATPLLLSAWLTRRAFYLELRPGMAVAGNAIYFVAMLGAAVLLLRYGWLSPTTAIAAMALASMLTALVHVVRLRPRIRAVAVPWRAALDDHWQYGRWTLASAVAVWFPLNVYYYVLPASSGLEAAGALRALLNVANPGLHSLAALTLVLTPAFVRAREVGGDPSVDRMVLRASEICFAGALAFLVPLAMFHADILRMLYGTKYAASVWPVMLAGLLPLAASVTTTVGSALRAIERPRQVFLSYAVFTLAAALIGVPLSSRWGVTGALSGMLLSYLALAMAMVFFYRLARRERS